MAYTIKQARPVLLKYLGLTEATANYITDTDNWGILYENNGQKCVIFIMPLGENTSSPKIYFDIRDSGAEKFVSAWDYAEKNNLKFFCLGVKDETLKYKDCVISVEADIHTVLKVSGLENGRRSGAGTQLNVPSTLLPQGKITRAKSNKFDIFFAVIKKDYLFTYLEVFDNRLFQFISSPNTQNVDNDAVDTIKLPRNRIIFGAPGTGKSHKLEKESESFIKQKPEEKSSFANHLLKCKTNGDFVKLGLLHSEELKKLSVSQIAEKYDKKHAYYIKKGAVYGVNEISSEEELPTEVEESLKKATHGELEAKGLEVGYKYCNIFEGKAREALMDTYGINSVVADWILIGVDAGMSTIDHKEEPIKFSERVTFHPNYGYAQFIGTYKPVKNEQSESEINYEYVPGPFMRVYVNAVNEIKRAKSSNEQPKNYLLIIEEINRANVAAVFGDVFQLLDRKSDGTSEYPIAVSEDIKKYLAKNGIQEDELSIPSNMYIWATMNSADQGVFPMDTAFKRRWEFEYIGIDENEKEIENTYIPINANKKVKWNELRKAINEKLIELGINEDKLLGPFFLNKTILENAMNNDSNFIKSFKSKVLMYLFEDAAKMKVRHLFNLQDNRYIYSEICKKFENDGLAVFNFKENSKISIEDIESAS